MFGGGFRPSKLKAELKMAVSRIQIASNKKSALLKQNMREVAVMLDEDPPKEEKAKIRSEALIRDDNLIEAYEILQLECELLAERIKLIEYSPTCPPDLVSVISTLMWASQRVDIPELLLIRKQFRAKYGKAFEEDAIRNVNGVLNERVVTKLSVEPPAAYLVQTYLEKICEQFQVDWKPTVRLTAEQMAEPMAAPVGYSVAVAQGTGLGTAVVYDSQSPSNNNDDAMLKFNGGIPPPVVTATAVPSNVGGGASVTSSVTAAAATATVDDFAEPDIYVPSAPGQPKTDDHTNGNHGDDKDDNDQPPSSDQNTSAYSDLAARFDSLKR